MRVKCLAHEHNTMFPPRLEATTLDPESSTVTMGPLKIFIYSCYFSTEITDTSSMGVVNMLGVFIFMLAGIIVGGFILIIEWIIAAFRDIDKWNPEVRDCVD